ncbi:hypothetical protein BDV96DRAFT_640801 [Lophiotrema nucula]|uniref:Uncharacterized protein n=1 Tax=Lophiotrema nucula TaxID=690887 RepID=A0A6A5ZSY5_9PLEO|nr:hypothetical protein BDV96DRAFT_640801 [Lophiotrema nucula]
MARTLAPTSSYTFQSICKWAKTNFPADHSHLPPPDVIQFANPLGALHHKNKRIYIGVIVKNKKVHCAYAYLNGRGPNDVAFEVLEGATGRKLSDDEVFEIEFEPPFVSVHRYLDDTFLQRLRATCLWYFCAKKFIPSMEMSSRDSKEWRTSFREACNSIAEAVLAKKEEDKKRTAGRKKVLTEVKQLEKRILINLDDDIAEPAQLHTSATALPEREQCDPTESEVSAQKRSWDWDDEVQEIPSEYLLPIEVF